MFSYLDPLVLASVGSDGRQGPLEVRVALFQESGDQFGNSDGGLEGGPHEATPGEVLKVATHQ